MKAKTKNLAIVWVGILCLLTFWLMPLTGYAYGTGSISTKLILKADIDNATTNVRKDSVIKYNNINKADSTNVYSFNRSYSGRTTTVNATVACNKVVYAAITYSGSPRFTNTKGINQAYYDYYDGKGYSHWGALTHKQSPVSFTGYVHFSGGNASGEDREEDNYYYTNVTIQASESAWGIDGNNHRTYCTGCGEWVQYHNKFKNAYWVTDASTHKLHCNIDGLESDSGAHSDSNKDGKCDICGRDIQSPSITRVAYTRDSTGFYAYAYVQDNVSVTTTHWWVWNSVNTSSDKWRYVDDGEAGSYNINGKIYNRRKRINISDFSNSTGAYHIDCRAYDAAGLCSDANFDNKTRFLRVASNVYIDSTKPTVMRATYIADANGYYAYLYATDNESISKTAFPSWTEYNGQDDLQNNWSEAALGTAGSWNINGQTYNYRYRVDKSAHNNESGPYTTHAYAYDASGNYNVLALTNIYLMYNVTYIDLVQNTTTELGRTTSIKKYASTVSGSDLGTDSTRDAYYSNYEYTGCTSATVTDKGTTVYRYFRLSTTAINFHDNGGSGGPGTVVWLIGSTQTPISPTREGYNFAGWNTKEDGTGNIWPKTGIVQIGITDYYAQWIPNMYTSVQEK